MNEWEWQLLEDKKPVDDLAFYGSRSAAGEPRAAASQSGRRHHGHCAGGENCGHRIDRAGLRGQSSSFVSWWTTIRDSDIGLMRQPGHRFFFDPEEVEPLAER